ncbi:uncharacterized protein PGTG_05922 [Puccinia graminis f. sp. tritici CRL 75-36-700-3]|uniref:Uncharacterized protein n=1 Tax=Puccinia graminis f. sp. tritici (strain CRL 75-36-700-3 / race SCCL) TaxID=418459 RepID=E3K630_PUCGT|nr:uncharacterized protein PGTG_05922 [Puccinia graminis f. sp. tritici CRL 75-36-700-3]EFP79601.1 hypothetical protein PGTG_05922 [Puccinia graminis f. sp. tritici CRL 75-36-700-3]
MVRSIEHREDSQGGQEGQTSIHRADKLNPQQPRHPEEDLQKDIDRNQPTKRDEYQEPIQEKERSLRDAEEQIANQTSGSISAKLDDPVWSLRRVDHLEGKRWISEPRR